MGQGKCRLLANRRTLRHIPKLDRAAQLRLLIVAQRLVKIIFPLRLRRACITIPPCSTRTRTLPVAGPRRAPSPASLLETIARSVRAPRGVIGVSVVGEDPHQLAGFHLPQADMMIVAGREQETVVEAEFSRWHRARMRQRFADELGCFRIPYANRIVGVNRGQQTAVMAEAGGGPRRAAFTRPRLTSPSNEAVSGGVSRSQNAGDVVSG